VSSADTTPMAAATTGMIARSASIGGETVSQSNRELSKTAGEIPAVFFCFWVWSTNSVRGEKQLANHSNFHVHGSKTSSDQTETLNF
jgi:hypothetical protein